MTVQVSSSIKSRFIFIYLFEDLYLEMVLQTTPTKGGEVSSIVLYGHLLYGKETNGKTKDSRESAELNSSPSFATEFV